MPFFSRKFKHRASQAGVGSQLALGVNNGSLAAFSPAELRADEDALVQDFLNIIEQKTIEINELKHQLNLKESALHDCLIQIDTPHADQNSELQRKTQEINSLKNALQEQKKLLQCPSGSGQQGSNKTHMNHDGQLEQLHGQVATLRENFEKKLSQQREEYASRSKDFQNRLSEEKRDSARTKARLENQIAEERRRFEEQMRIEKDEAQSQLAAMLVERNEAESQVELIAGRMIEELNQTEQKIHELEKQVQLQTEITEQMRAERVDTQAREARAQQVAGRLAVESNQQRRRLDELDTQLQIERNEAQARAQQRAVLRAERDEARSQSSNAQQVATQLREELDRKGQRMDELDTQLQTQTETAEQTRLALNRTRNELNEEKRKARRATDESAIKNQQLEFVQQQCARMHDDLHRRKKGMLRLQAEIEGVLAEKAEGEDVHVAVKENKEDLRKDHEDSVAPKGEERVQCASQ